jgi:hypothetical protein
MGANNSAEPAAIPVTELRAILNLILDHIVDDLGVTSIPIDPARELYWDIPQKQLSDLSNETPHLGIGSLRDDWYFLTTIGTARSDAVALMLIHAAPLLRYIGEKIGR